MKNQTTIFFTSLFCFLGVALFFIYHNNPWKKKDKVLFTKTFIGLILLLVLGTVFFEGMVVVVLAAAFWLVWTSLNEPHGPNFRYW